MSEDDLKLLQRIRDVQLAKQVRHRASGEDWASEDYMPWACWGYAGSHEIEIGRAHV